jgi:hypothetical protein
MDTSSDMLVNNQIDKYHVPSVICDKKKTYQEIPESRQRPANNQ